MDLNKRRSLLLGFWVCRLSKSPTVVALVGPFLTQNTIDVVFLELSNLPGGKGLDSLDESGHSVSHGLVGDLLGLLSGIVEDTTLGLRDELVGVPGIQHKLVNVGLQPVLIQVEGFLTTVLATMIDSNADGTGEGNTESSSLDLSKGESFMASKCTSALTDFAVVSDGLSMNQRPEGVSGSGSSDSSLLPTSYKTAALATGLVEPDGDVSLPVLPEMDVRHHVVVLNHELFYIIIAI